MIARRFIPYYGPDAVRLPSSPDHLQFKWVEPGVSVCFSCARQGRAMSCHYTADREGNRRIHEAIDDFCNFVFHAFPWCDMILAKIKMRRVARVVRECGFEFVKSLDNFNLYMMRRGAYGIRG